MSESIDPPVLPPKLSELLEAIEAVRRDTLLLVGSSAGTGLFAGISGEWSPEELLEHLLLAEAGAGKVVRKVLRESGGALPHYPSDDSGIRVRQPVTFDGMEAPPSARPGAVESREALLAGAEATRAATRETLRMLAAVDPRAAEFPHHRFGPLNLYEWLAIVILEHEKGHRRQLQSAVTGGGP